jgi:enoyl reductase-like protein/3-oxoacyl-ACP reductase-like protein/acyl transferase domain-containing protein
MSTQVFGASGARVQLSTRARRLRVEGPIAVTFAGQASDYLEELASMRRLGGAPAALIEGVLAELERYVDGMPAEDRAFFTEGFSAREWLSRPEARPSERYRQSVAVSFPLIFATQLGHYERLREAGLAQREPASVRLFAGHSQGIMAAVAASLAGLDGDLASVARVFAPMGLAFALRMQQAWPVREPSPRCIASARAQGLDAPTPMASVTGLLRKELDELLAGTRGAVTCALDNTLFRQVVSGAPDELERFRERLFAAIDDRRKRRKERATGGRVPEVQWQYLPVSAPFHSEAMRPGMQRAADDACALGFRWGTSDLSVAVLDTDRAMELAPTDSLLDRLITAQFVGSVRWRAMCDAIAAAGVRSVIDCGPGDALHKLTYSNLRGTGAAQWAMADDRTLGELGSGVERAVTSAASYPRSIAVGERVENAFTKLTAAPPVILAGMTPTTVDAPLVAAAANAGYVAELAGGGQVTEAVLRLRLEELAERLEPGRAVVFNALYLDPYLWKLHFGGPRPLVLRLIEEGFALRGVTVSAGVPPKDEAVALLRALNRAGATVNSLKPGNDRELKEALAIAAEIPELSMIIQIEGGLAGGHHSWEDLDDLLLRHYPALRSLPNVIVAVGGGVATPERAGEYIDGTWAARYGSRPLPIDAVFIGTAAMACLEATTSPSVKRALVAAKGTDRWIADGTFVDGVTSGRSQLDASVYYLDTSAARAGRLLDEVAGNEESVRSRRDEIIAALAKTARPYFGDVESMTYAQFIDRWCALTATGRHGRYEDGPWPDRSYRTRFLEALRLCEARLADERASFESLFDEASLDHPAAAVARLRERYPNAERSLVHPQDALAFVALCRTPGKPVPFVAVVDRDVRRWFKADSLSNAHDDRFDADQVLALPGPRSLSAIERVDEPVASLLERFSRGIVAALPSPTSGRDRDSRSERSLVATETLAPTEAELRSPERWLRRLASLDDGPVCSMLEARRAYDAVAKRWTGNALRSLLAPRAGMRVTLLRGPDGKVTTLRSEDAALDGRTRVILDAQGASLRSYRKNAADGKDGREASLDLCLAWRGTYLAHDRARHLRAQRAFYGQLLFGRPLVEVAPFDVATSTITVDREAVCAFAYATGDQPGRLVEEGSAPLAMCFSLLWEPMFSALSGALPDVTRLLHEEVEVEAGPAWPLRFGQRVEGRAAIVAVESGPEGTRISVEGVIECDRGRAATVSSRFFVRGQVVEKSTRKQRELLPFERALFVRDEGALAFLRERPFVTFEPLEREIAAPASLVLRCEELAHDGDRATARGGIYAAADGARVATIDCDVPGATREHPVRALAAVLAAADMRAKLAPARMVLDATAQAPLAMDAYAAASGDGNPLHTDGLVASLAGLSAPIVHGMWTASCAAHRLSANAGGARALRKLSARFEAPVSLGESLVIRGEQTAVLSGAPHVSLTVTSALDERVVLRADAELFAPKTAYVFPGQGIQRKAMGMQGYARSAAARGVWDEADAHCREALGFSLLRVIRENPTELVVRGERFAHPQGVLFLTQFTQVAMVVLAVAQVSELREQWVFAMDAMFAGHSLGEYSALSAVAGVVPLRAAIEVVYARGLTMDRLVPRDADGRTPYAMVVVKPHVARLDDQALRELIASCATVDEPLEIVNFNVRGRQYSVTGHVAAVARLEASLRARSDGPGAKPSISTVPGVDVPFHSTLLRDGVDRFRATLERAFDPSLDARPLIGRYVPNLTGRRFSLDREELARIADETGSPVLAALLAGDGLADERALSRALLIELLAFQFASPVRWIDTQELFFRECALDRFVEVGIAEQPTLANMASASLATLRLVEPRVLNSEAHASELVGPPQVIAESPATKAPTSAPTNASAPAPAAAVARAAPEVRRGASGGASMVFAAGDALRVVLALQARVRLEQLDAEQSVDELLGGNSARRNQLLADIAQEFNIAAIDGAHELSLSKLSSAIEQRANGYAQSGFGRYLAPSIEQRVASALGAGRVTVADAQAHLASRWGLDEGAVRHALSSVALESRPGDSSRGGALSLSPPAAITDRSSALQWVDAVVLRMAEQRGVSLAPAGEAQASSTMVDSEALSALSSRVLGPDGALYRGAVATLRALGHDPTPALEPSAQDPARAKLEAIEREHDDRYFELTKGCFSASKHLALTSASSWLRRDLAQLFFDAMSNREGVEQALVSVARRLDKDGREAARALARRAEKLCREDVARRLDAVAMNTGDVIHGAPRVALVTGAGPGSIALSMVGDLLEEGARVVVTTSRYTDERLASLRALYRERATPGAELHVLPLNQGSFEDVDALCDWLASEGLLPDLCLPFAALGESATLADVGPRSLVTLRIQLVGVERLLAKLAAKMAVEDDLARRCHVVLPLSPNHGIFGGDGLYGESKAALEVLIARQKSERSAWGRRFSIVGARIGWVRGTGLMASNDGLADMLEREHGLKTFTTDEMAAALLALCTADAQERAAQEPFIEDLTAGFGALRDLGSRAAKARSVAERDRRAKQSIEALRGSYRERTQRPIAARAMLSPAPREEVSVPIPSDAELEALPPLDHLSLDRVAVVVGMGEVSPWGSSRTRWSVERDERPSVEALYELAWMTGLVATREDGALIDAASKQQVSFSDLRERYESIVLQKSGIRVVQGAAAHGFDPAHQLRHTEVHVDEPMAFSVSSVEHAERFREADPEHVRVEQGEGGAVRVHIARGAKVRVASKSSLTRRVVGQVPEGWSAERYGISKAMIEQVDRVTLYNLVATVEAFVSAGLEPEELYEHLHLSRVACTQSSGIGGMQKLRRLYHDGMLDRERQQDVLQETLVNVISGWMVQAYVGSYGPISSPVGACATAALSVAEALDLLSAGRADFVVTGGCDDYNEEGAVGFSDMGATADSIEASSRGISPRTLSRPNDRRRMGFVEAQGAGALLVCRASTALAMGLPVYGVVAMATSHSDGINASVPAPGQGVLAVAAESAEGRERRADACQFAARREAIAKLAGEREQLSRAMGVAMAERVQREARAHLGHTFYREDPAVSPLRGALAVYGLEADDVAFVSKHDTSTNANDSNESALHARLASALGRTQNLPLPVVSQKSLTGHSKGGAAAWQLIGALQAMSDGVIPGNRSLEDVAPSLQRKLPLCFSDTPLRAGSLLLRAALVTSLGFGHVGAIVAVVHPYFFWRSLDATARARYRAAVRERVSRATQTLRRALAGTRPFYARRVERPFVDKESTDAHARHEAAVLLDRDARRTGGRYAVAVNGARGSDREDRS